MCKHYFSVYKAFFQIEFLDMPKKAKRLSKPVKISSFLSVKQNFLKHETEITNFEMENQWVYNLK